MTDGIDIARGLLGAAQVGDGPTAEQRSVVAHLLHGYFGSGGGGDLVAHDFTHVLAGYEPDPPGELALQAMLTSATGFEHHFSSLVASLALYEAGKFDILELQPKAGALARPGAAAELAEAFRRGAQCACNFSTMDHLARADEPLHAVRADCGIVPR